jgi:hypothetical protein
MPAIKLRGSPPQDPALLCHPEVVRDHTARLVAMERRLDEVAQNQRESMETGRAVLSELKRRNAGLVVEGDSQ